MANTPWITFNIIRMKEIKIILHIRRTSDGETRKLEEIAYLADGEQYLDTFIFEEGNYACDCNRELFFARAIGSNPEETYCSSHRFEINVEVKDTGEIIYKEF